MGSRVKREMTTAMDKFEAWLKMRYEGEPEQSSQSVAIAQVLKDALEYLEELKQEYGNKQTATG